MRFTAIMDCSSLVYLSTLHAGTPLLNYLRNIFQTIYIPLEVKTEFSKGASKELHREEILLTLGPDSGFWRLCTVYDSFAMAFVENRPGIDKGEAESYAQYMKTGAHFIISDDTAFASAVKKFNKYAQIYNSLHVLSWLQLAGFMPNWERRLVQLYKIRPFTAQKLRTAYMEIAKRLGLEVSKKQLRKTCSLSKFLQSF